MATADVATVTPPGTFILYSPDCHLILLALTLQRDAGLRKSDDENQGNFHIRFSDLSDGLAWYYSGEKDACL